MKRNSLIVISVLCVVFFIAAYFYFSEDSAHPDVMSAEEMKAYAEASNQACDGSSSAKELD